MIRIDSKLFTCGPVLLIAGVSAFEEPSGHHNSKVDLPNDFMPHYDAHIRPLIRQFEDKRIVALRKLKERMVWGLAGAVLLIIAAVVLMFMIRINGDVLDVGLAITVFGLAGIAAWVNEPARRYSTDIKAFIFPLIFQYFGSAYRYKDISPLTADMLKPSAIIPEYDRASANDYVSGEHNNITIEMFSSHLTKRVRSRNGHSNKTVFKGAFIQLSTHKRFSGHTIVTQDAGMVGNWMSGTMRRIGGTSLETVRLEDPIFEKKFEVYASDQVEARYLLTTSFMERLVELSELFGQADIECSFYDDRLLLKIPMQQERFVASSAFDLVTFVDDIQSILKEMQLVFDIIELLKLDQTTRL